MKVAKAQHIKMKSQCIEESGSSSLSVEIDEVLNRIAIPFYQIIGIKIRFYLLLPINGDLYGVFEWAFQELPSKDDDVDIASFLCKKFLIYRVGVF